MRVVLGGLGLVFGFFHLIVCVLWLFTCHSLVVVGSGCRPVFVGLGGKWRGVW